MKTRSLRNDIHLHKHRFPRKWHNSHLGIGIVCVFPEFRGNFAAELRQGDDFIQIVAVHDGRQRPACFPEEISCSVVCFLQRLGATACLGDAQVLNERSCRHGCPPSVMLCNFFLKIASTCSVLKQVFVQKISQENILNIDKKRHNKMLDNLYLGCSCDSTPSDNYLNHDRNLLQKV